MSRLGNILLPLGAAVSTNLALGLHFEDNDDSYTFSEVTGKTASLSHSARIYAPGSAYRLVADFPFSNATQLTDQTGRHTLGTFSGSAPASGKDYIWFDPTATQKGEFSPGGDYQGDYDATEDYKVVFDMAVKVSGTSSVTVITTGNNYTLTTGYLTFGVNINSSTKKWRLTLQHGGSAATGTVDHDCDLNASDATFTTFYTVTLTVSGSVATATTSLDTISSAMPANLWRHYLTTKGPTLAARVNSFSGGVPGYALYSKIALKNYKQYVKDDYPVSIPSNGSFGKYILSTGGDRLKFDGHSDFTFTSSSNWTMRCRFMLLDGPADSNAVLIPIYIGDITSTTLGTRGYIKLTPSSAGGTITAQFFGTNTSTAVGGAVSTTPRNVWHEVMVCRNGSANQTRIYLDGTQAGSTANVYVSLTTPPVYIGGGYDGSAAAFGWGLIDDLYIRKTCEQTGTSYTPSTTPFPL